MKKIICNIPLMESFYTIQGEGANTGLAAYFIRTAGCDVGCTWCDVKESWGSSKFLQINIESILNYILKLKCKNIVITGGEPCIYDLNILTKTLKNVHLNTWLETSGVYPISGIWDWICFSPKKFKNPLEENYKKANELKIIITNKHDFKWAEKHAQKVNKNTSLFLQVEWGEKEKLTPLIVDYVKKIHTGEFLCRCTNT